MRATAGRVGKSTHSAVEDGGFARGQMTSPSSRRRDEEDVYKRFSRGKAPAQNDGNGAFDAEYGHAKSLVPRKNADNKSKRSGPKGSAESASECLEAHAEILWVGPPLKADKNRVYYSKALVKGCMFAVGDAVKLKVGV